MSKANCKLTVFFEDPFWVGVYERWEERRYTACRIVFGAEPREQEIYTLLLERFHTLRFSPPLNTEAIKEKRLNPKRMQRNAKRELSHPGAGTKSQEAFKLQREAGKEVRRKRTRIEKEAEQERQFELRRQKQKARHKGH